MYEAVISTGGYLFWLLLLAAVLINIGQLASDEDNGGWATFVAAVTFIAAVLFTDAFAGARLLLLIPLALAYVAIGVGWAIWKWRALVIDKRDQALAAYQPSDVNDVSARYEYMKRMRPTAAEFKPRIMAWMILWPYSVTWWVLTYPRRALVWLYQRLTTLFDRMAERIFAS